MAPLTLEEAVDCLTRRIRGEEPYVVFTPNPEMIDRSMRDGEFRRQLLLADLLVADGVGLLWASRVFRTPLPGTVPGVDLMESLLAACGSGVGVFLLGTTPPVVQEAANRASQRGVRVVGFHHGFFSAEEEPPLIDLICRCAPGLILSGMGIRRDQAFAVRWRDRLPPGVYLGVGGGLNILAGHSQRAPRGVRRLGLEWLYRLISSPRRWRRQIALPRFVWNVLYRRFLM